MLILKEYFKTKMKKIVSLERMLHCVKIVKLKKLTLYMYTYKITLEYSSFGRSGPENYLQYKEALTIILIVRLK